jgi:hypothetical protein
MHKNKKENSQYTQTSLTMPAQNAMDVTREIVMHKKS